MTYVTASALEGHLGAERYLSISDRDRDGAADAVAVAGALAKASSIADSYLSHLLPIPSPYPESLVDAVMAIATYRLAGNAATTDERQQYEDAINWLRDIARGRARLSTSTEDVPGGGEVLHVDADDTEWSQEKAGGIF